MKSWPGSERSGFILALVPWLFCFLSGCSSVFYQPDSVLYYNPDKFGLKKQDIKFASGDGTQLFAWLFSPTDAGRPAKGTVVQFHGNAENISSHYLSLAWLTHSGYRLFTWDYRGYGLSAGTPSPEGVYEDSKAALREAWSRHKAVARPGELFIVFGQSLGGAVAMRALQDFPERGQVSLVVMDSTFLSYKKVARKKLAGSWLTWIFSPLGSLLVTDRFEASASLAQNRSPLLVIHDKRDPVMPLECGKEIYDLAPDPKDYWELDQGRHIGVFSEDNQKEKKRFVDYLERLATRVARP